MFIIQSNVFYDSLILFQILRYLFPLFLFCPVVLLMGVSLTTNIWFGASSLSFHTIPDAATSVLMAAIGDFRPVTNVYAVCTTGAKAAFDKDTILSACNNGTVLT